MSLKFYGLVFSLLVLVLGPSDASDRSGKGDLEANESACGDRYKGSANPVKGSDRKTAEEEATAVALAELLCWTVTHSAYDAPKSRPEVEFRAAVYFAARVCSTHVECAARGAYRDGSNTIILHESQRDLSNPHARAMLVHELVHFLQDHSGRWGDTGCRLWVAREREAYLIQYRYLIVKGGFPPATLRLPSISETACAPS